MPAQVTEVPRRSASAGALLILGIALGLYQATSLALGPLGIRQLHLSLQLPAIDSEAPGVPLVTDFDVVLGAMTTPASALPTSLRLVALQSSFSQGLPTSPISIQNFLAPVGGDKGAQKEIARPAASWVHVAKGSPPHKAGVDAPGCHRRGTARVRL
jgi:hypothetical protein